MLINLTVSVGSNRIFTYYSFQLSSLSVSNWGVLGQLEEVLIGRPPASTSRSAKTHKSHIAEISQHHAGSKKTQTLPMKLRKHVPTDNSFFRQHSKKSQLLKKSFIYKHAWTTMETVCVCNLTGVSCLCLSFTSSLWNYFDALSFHTSPAERRR